MGWEYWEYVVLAAIAGFLAIYVRQSYRISHSAGSELQDLLDGFTKNIKDRAARGQEPDWLRYSEESDRQHEYDCERLRNFATTALATGIGGTMFILILQRYMAGESDQAQSLLQAMPFALVASGLGVATNLVILLRVFKSANKRFDGRRESFMQHLREAADENVPVTPDTRSPDTLSERLEEILQNVARDLPGVIGGFRESVASLGKVSTVFSASTEKMESATAVLSASVNKLNALPKNLGDQLAKARLRWADDVKENQERYLAEFRQVLDGQQEAVQEVQETMSALATSQGERAEADARWQKRLLQEQNKQHEAVSGLLKATTDVATEVKRLPVGFRKEIDRASDTLGRSFGEQARKRVSDMVTAIQRENREAARILDGHVGRLVDQTDAMVQTMLSKMGDVVQAFVDHGTAFRESLDSAARQRAAADARWREQLKQEQDRQHEAAHKLLHATGDVADEVKGLPSGFRKEIDRASDTLGRSFGEQAHNHVSELRDVIQRENREVTRTLGGHVQHVVDQNDEMVQRMLSKMGGVVQEGLKQTAEGITAVGRNLEAAGTAVQRSIGEFADHGAAFKDSLDGAARQIDESSAKLADTHAETQESIGEIQRGYGKLYEDLIKSGDSIRSLLESIRSLLEKLSVRRRGILSRVGSRVKRLLRRNRSAVKRDNQHGPIE